MTVQNGTPTTLRIRVRAWRRPNEDWSPDLAMVARTDLLRWNDHMVARQSRGIPMLSWSEWEANGKR